jgi:cytochrome c oxidase assembly protein subunit 15
MPPVSDAAPPSGLGGARRRLPEVSPATLRSAAVASLAASVLIVLTGAAVRLTGSGLGCPDWPSCNGHRLTAELSYHPVIEFGNRLVTVLFVVVVAATLLAALRRRPYRRDLTALAGALVGGVLAQAVLGGLVVYTKLNPYLVMVHFLASLAVVVAAVVLLHRSSRDYRPGSGTPLVAPPLRLLARATGALLAVVLAAGTAATGAGPHAGGSQGQLVAKRLPVTLRDMAELHSSLALLLIGAVAALAVALHAVAVPERVRRATRMLTIVLFAQGAVGYTQYFTHLPALLVELHVAGATVLTVAATQFLLTLTHHPAETPAGTGSSGFSDGDATGPRAAPPPSPPSSASAGGRRAPFTRGLRTPGAEGADRPEGVPITG